ncbi:MAG: peptidoglycan DD-metalloendopeptidase family protein [bacterium]|nr:peptidoglycan DD-metalloendopeptidase family protein [bacterium]
MMIKKTAIVFIILLAFFSPAFSQKKEAKLDELDKLRNDIESFKKTLSKKNDEEKTVLGNLQEIEHEINLRTNLLRKLSREENNSSVRIDNNRKELRKSKRTLKELQSLYKERAVKMYKYGKKSTVELFLDTKSFSSAAALRKYYSSISRRDENLMGSIKDRAERIINLTGSLENDLIRKRSIRETKENEAAILNNNKKNKENILNTIQRDKNRVTLAIAEKQKAEKELLEVIANITGNTNTPKKDIDLPDFSLEKGKLPWPVTGELFSKAGIEKDPATSVKIQNKGVEILTEYGESVRTVGKGEIARIKWLPWYGQTIFIRHSKSYYTVYARLEQVYVNVGDVVDEQQVIGTVGKEAVTSQAKLNFQVWKGADNLDPEDWLSSNQAKNTIITGSMKKNRSKN